MKESQRSTTGGFGEKDPEAAILPQGNLTTYGPTGSDQLDFVRSELNYFLITLLLVSDSY